MTDRAELYATLRSMMLDSAQGMRVVKDVEGELLLHAPWPNPTKPKEPMWFGMVKSGKAYVSYHLIPLYVVPETNDGIPENLEKRRQGKSCFNFKVAEPEALAALDALTRRCAAAFAQPVAPK